MYICIQTRKKVREFLHISMIERDIEARQRLNSLFERHVFLPAGSSIPQIRDDNFILLQRTGRLECLIK